MDATHAPTLTEFLLARIGEDEAIASPLTADPSLGWWTPADLHEEDMGWEEARHMSRHSPTRVLVECEAKRKIIERYAEVPDPRRERSHGVEARTLGIALRCIALPYADHPDYREEWKP